MKKRLILIIIAALLVLALLVAVFGLPLVSKLYYHRSQAATLFAWQLQKEAYTDEEAFQELLGEKHLMSRPPYLIPADCWFSIRVDAEYHDGMQYYVINPQEAPEKLMVYFAGGSFTDQPRTVHWTFLNQLAADTGAMIVLPIYPKIPAADAETAYAAMMRFYEDCIAPMDCKTLFFMGDSAGGGMALSLAMELRDAGIPGPEELILMCPWVDVTMTNPDIPRYERKDGALDSAMLARLGELWAGKLDPTDPLVSPLYGTFEGLGTIHLITSEGELLYPDIMLLSKKLADSGIGHHVITDPGMFHVWPLYIGYNVPEVEETYSQITAMISNAN